MKKIKKDSDFYDDDFVKDWAKIQWEKIAGPDIGRITEKTDEEILEKMDIKKIETFLRKKKSERLGKKI